MQKIILGILIVIVIIFGGMFVFGPRAESPTLTPVPSGGPLLGVTESATPAPQETVQTGAVKEFTVVARQYSFEPSEIRVKKGDTVNLTVQNIDVAHGIAIPEFGFTIQAAAGQSAFGSFVADKTGTFDFFCSVFCGSGHKGMKGTLVVE